MYLYVKIIRISHPACSINAVGAHSGDGLPAREGGVSAISTAATTPRTGHHENLSPWLIEGCYDAANQPDHPNEFS